MLFVGQAALQGDIARYAQHFNLLELLAERGRLPKPARLAEWRHGVGEAFAFSLRLPRRVWEADAGELNELVSHAARVGELLRAEVCLLQTPASATPTERNRQRLARLCDELRSLGTRLAWEPHGLWQRDELEALADELGVLLVRDLSRDDQQAHGSTVYTRLLALGDATRVRSGAAYQVAEKLADCERAYVVMEGTGARSAAKILRESSLEPYEPTLTGDSDDDTSQGVSQ